MGRSLPIKTGHPWLSCILSPACPSGSYRVDTDVPHCLKCPGHSTTESEGATICPCESGHFRAPGEGPQVSCTRESKEAGLGYLQGGAAL